ncbi:cytochrome P450 family protein [Rhizoctonia solani]|uniref:Cytochrome P450 family protein n=1 Tax=Rhizoctonia solani TaxID=456999 RepID=A0A8H8T0H6_9AGAM|nr:cytochrome P450 family protein [Rhizoctonia solani]QRW25406.1 cytochrome P450 family protein [Rhizoctonia solani]
MDEHLVYAQWCKELNSDIISLTVLGQNIIIVNSVEVARHLLDQRSTIYSSRPYLRAISDPDYLDDPLVRDSATVVEKFTVAAVPASRLPRQLHPLVKDLWTLVRDSATVVEKFTVAAVPANFLVNFIPWLKYVPEWFPGAQWKRNIIQWRHLKDHVKNYPYEWAKAQIASGFAAPSIVQTLLASVEGNPKANMPEEEENLRRVSVSLFGAAADTSHASLMSFVLAMVQHPDVQARAQKEIDDVTKSERLPTMADRDSMPYIRSIVQEACAGSLHFRWGYPSYLRRRRVSYIAYDPDDLCNRITNSWAMSRDESVYKSPDQFIPDRFIGLDVPTSTAFGFGRR